MKNGSPVGSFVRPIAFADYMSKRRSVRRGVTRDRSRTVSYTLDRMDLRVIAAFCWMGTLLASDNFADLATLHPSKMDPHRGHRAMADGHWHDIARRMGNPAREMDPVVVPGLSAAVFAGHRWDAFERMRRGSDRARSTRRLSDLEVRPGARFTRSRALPSSGLADTPCSSECSPCASAPCSRPSR